MKWNESCSVVSDSLQSYGLYSPWDSPGQNTGVGCHPLLQGDLPNPRIEPRSPALQEDSLPTEPQGKPKNTVMGCQTLLKRSSWPRDQTHLSYVSCTLGRFFTMEPPAVPSSRGSFQPRDQSQVSRIAGWFFTVWATGSLLIHKAVFFS